MVIDAHSIIQHLETDGFNLIDITTSKLSLEEKIQSIENLYNNHSNIVYFFTRYCSKEFLKCIREKATFPNSDNLLVIFFKADYIYLDDSNSNIDIINNFIRNANFDTSIECKDCKQHRDVLLYCQNCQSLMCKICIFDNHSMCLSCYTPFPEQALT
jgi:hypothetical protein